MTSLSDCDSPLGIESGDIPNSDMTASSEVSKMEFISPLSTIAAHYERFTVFFHFAITCFCSGMQTTGLALLGLIVQLVGERQELGPRGQVT